VTCKFVVFGVYLGGLYYVILLMVVDRKVS